MSLPITTALRIVYYSALNKLQRSLHRFDNKAIYEMPNRDLFASKRILWTVPNTVTKVLHITKCLLIKLRIIVKFYLQVFTAGSQFWAKTI